MIETLEHPQQTVARHLESVSEMVTKIITFLWLISLPAFSAVSQETNLNDQIVHFCEQHLGQKVGDGECFDLASHALHEVGLTRHFRDNPCKGDYVWGKLVLYLQGNGSKPENVAPGDIIQFRDAVFKHKRKSDSFGHHTAIVDQVSNNGHTLKILQENFSGKKFVTALNLNLLELKSGWVRIYQPVRSEK